MYLSMKTVMSNIQRMSTAYLTYCSSLFSYIDICMVVPQNKSGQLHLCTHMCAVHTDVHKRSFKFYQIIDIRDINVRKNGVCVFTTRYIHVGFDNLRKVFLLLVS